MSNYRGFKNYKNYSDFQEKIFSALSYITMGFVGFVLLIVSHIQKKQLSSFARYHIFQSLFISILFYVFNLVFSIIYNSVGIIPFIGNFVQNIIYFFVQCPIVDFIVINFSLLQFAVLIINFYLAFFAFTGRYGKIPWVSDRVREMV